MKGKSIYNGVPSSICNGVKFAKDLPNIINKTLSHQKPFRDAFIKRLNIDMSDYENWSSDQSLKIQKKWIKSPEFQEMIKEKNTNET